MLSHIAIKDIVLIDKLEIDLPSGFSVFTGETGAGKSILLDALSLALGARGDASLVRANKPQGSVVVSFDIPSDHPANQFLVDNEINVEDVLLLRRIQYADGKSKAYVNDQPVSVAFLRSLSKKIIELHGQHADRAFIDVDIHMDMLDNFGNLWPQRNKVNEAYRKFKHTNQLLKQHKEKCEQARKEEEYIRSSIAELSKLAIIEGEETELVARRAHLMKSEKMAADIQEIASFLSGQNSPITPLASFLRRMERRDTEEQELIQPLISSLDKIITDLNDFDYNIAQLLSDLDFDENELETVENRLFTLRAMARKHNVSIDQLPKLLTEFEENLQSLDDGNNLELLLEKQLTEERSIYDEAAKILSQQREECSKLLTLSMHKEMEKLKLGQATFIVKLDADFDNLTERGYDKVEFWVQTNPGAAAGPMMKVASGGELSRLLLALKVCLSENDSVLTLIFDEVDTGVSGAVSSAIGLHLATLAKKVQLICITHAPQVAAFAHQHFLIKKSIADIADNSSPITNIYKINDEEREEELARLLAGDTITQEARAAARRLIAEGGLAFT